MELKHALNRIQLSVYIDSDRFWGGARAGERGESNV